jgi:hypothetical protein
LKIAILGSTNDVRVVRELLSPWKVSFTRADEADATIFYKEKVVETKKTVVIPSESSNFITCIKDQKLDVKRKLRERVSVATSSKEALTISPRLLYCYDGLAESARRSVSPTAIELEGNLAVLTLDVVREYNEILYETLNAKQSTIFRLFTGLSIPYNVVPNRLRDLIMKRNDGHAISTFCDKLAIDALRFILVEAIESLMGRKLDKRMWNRKEYAIMLTHDVDTRRGLLRAKVLKRIENDYDVPSAWYIPSKLYKIDAEIIKELANNGEIGAHDTKHDGKLENIPESKLTERFIEARKELKRILGDDVKGFRAPLLQHSARIIQALKKAGYIYDSSIPTWESRHPKTMKSHGIATTYPLTVEGVTEIPVTLPQDHQLLHVLGLSPKDAINQWSKITSFVKKIGGVCTFLIHPDYDLANEENLGKYEELLNSISSDKEALISLPIDVTSLVSSLEA